MTTQVTLEGLLPPLTSDDVEALLLQTLQGIGPVQQIGQGAGQVVPAGSPLANYDIILTIGTAGAPGTATFTYSLDDGVTTNGPYTVPSNGIYLISGSGLTLNFSGVFNSQDEYIFQTIFPPFQPTDFQSGSASLTFIKAESNTEADLAGSAIANVAGGGFVDYASDQNAPNDWLTLLSQQQYNNDRADPISTQGILALTMAPTASSQTFAAGALIVSNSLGAGSNVFQYVNSSPFTINPGDTLAVAIQAMGPGAAYNLANGTISSIITPKPGMTCVNSAPGTSAVAASGGATGGVTVSGSPNGNYSVVLKVLSTGALGTATAQVSLDGGSDYAAPITLPGSGSYAIPTLNGLALTGLTLTLTGTFTAGDSYTFTSYASWILVGGADLESSLSLQTRDKARWPTLGVTQANPALVWTLLVQATPNGGSEVTKVFAAPDLVTGGQLNITVAGPAGPVSVSALANISAFVSARAGLGYKTVTQNAIVQTLAVVGTVYVVAAQEDAAKAAISTAFNQLAAATPIQGVVTFASIEAAIENQSASGVTNVHVTSPAPNVDTQLNASSTVLFDLTGLVYVLQ
jgi:hypothetical protein